MFFQLNPKERAGYVALVVVLLAIAGVVGYRHGADVPSGDAEQVTAKSSTKTQRTSALDTPPAPATVSSGRILVEVRGAVKKPGVYELRSAKDYKSDPRVKDAIHMAGGALKTADLGAINLAAKLTDAEQINIPIKASPTSPVTPAGSSAVNIGAVPVPAGLHPSDESEAISRKGKILAGAISLNSATLEELQTLPGVGPATAQRILQYRTTHGPFKSLDDLRQVGGIGDKKLSKMAPYLRL